MNSEKLRQQRFIMLRIGILFIVLALAFGFRNWYDLERAALAGKKVTINA